MKIDFLREIVDVRDGKPMSYEKDGARVNLTLQHAAATALDAVMNDEASTDNYKSKLKRAKLLERLYLTPQCDVELEEVTLILDRMGKLYGPLVVLAANKIFDPEAK